MIRAHAQYQYGSVCCFYSMSACVGGYVHDCFSTQLCKWVHGHVCVGPSTLFSCFGTAYPQLWLNTPALPDSVQASRRHVRSNLAHRQKSLPGGELSWVGKSKTPTWLAGLPRAERRAWWHDLISPTEQKNHSRGCRSCLLLCNME